MKETIVNLVSCYKDFLMNVSEYTILSEHLKKLLIDDVATGKLKQPKKLVKYYSLEVKLRDFSCFEKDIISYLLENKLDKFISKEIDPMKVKALVADGLLDNDIVSSFIEKEKTTLCIKSDEILASVNSYKQSVRHNINALDTFSIIKRRELLKGIVNSARHNYFNAAKATKDVLMANAKNSIKVKVADSVVSLEIKTVKTIYSDTFVQYLEDNNLDAFKYTVDDTKLRNSKDKKLNISEINKFRVDFSKDYLYIKALPGLLQKYNKKRA